MPFIVKKKIHGRDYYYLNKTERIDGKVKSTCLGYLGKTRQDAEKKSREILAKVNKSDKSVSFDEEKMENIKKINLSEKAENILSITGTRGIFFQTASIYGGKAGFFTYGHLGKKIKSNWEGLWKKYFFGINDNFYEIQSNNILPANVFVASGHIDNFNDPLVECKKCHSRFRADHLLEDKGIKDSESLGLDKMNKEILRLQLKCSKCSGEFTEIKQFNMMFPVSIGFEEDKGYLSPETAQGAYLVFKEEFLATRGKLPLGLAIIDKAYRNEISPRQGFFRLREFTQAELQIFFDEEKLNEHEKWELIKDKKLFIKFSDKEEIEEISCGELNKDKKIPRFYLYYQARVQEFYLNQLKIPKEKFRFRELGEKERAFYNKIHFDVEIYFDVLNSFKEVGGVHYRTDHDLKRHQEVSGKNLEVNIDGKKFIPHVLELSFGVDRNIYALLDVFFDINEEGYFFKFPSKLSPIKIAVLPLVRNNENLLNLSRDVFEMIRPDFESGYDSAGSIGRRYARNDEIGTPYCITIDGDSLKNKDVTVRERDTRKQIRVKIENLKEFLFKLINSEINFEK